MEIPLNKLSREREGGAKTNEGRLLEGRQEGPKFLLLLLPLLLGGTLRHRQRVPRGTERGRGRWREWQSPSSLKYALEVIRGIPRFIAPRYFASHVAVLARRGLGSRSAS